MLKNTVLTLFLSFSFLPLTAFALPYQKCDLNRCYSKSLAADQKDQVVNQGKTLSISDVNTGSQYQMNYIYKYIPAVTPELAIAVFSNFEEHETTLNPPILKSKPRFLGRKGQEAVEYLLDTSKVLSGMGALSPQSKYVVVENISKTHGQEGLVWWEIDKTATDALYEDPKAKKGFFGKLKDAVSMDSKGKPEYIHGFFFVEAVEGGVVLTYANYIIPETKMMSGTVNKQAADALVIITEKTAEVIQKVASQGPEIQAKYIKQMCERYF